LRGTGKMSRSSGWNWTTKCGKIPKERTCFWLGLCYVSITSA